MGLSNQGWRPPLTWDDLEFQNGRLAKVRGSRPMYMDGYQLQETLYAVAAMLFAEKDRGDNYKSNFQKPKSLSPDADPGGDSSANE